MRLTANLGGFNEFSDPPQSRNWHFLFSEKIMDEINEKRGIPKKNFKNHNRFYSAFT